MGIDGRAPARGIVVTPAEAANEGVDRMLDTLQFAGANSVAISPGLFVPSTAVDGVREPPLDIEGEARVLDRPLWGSRVQYLKGYSPYPPDPAVWRDVPFEAPSAAPEDLRIDYAALVIAGASSRGMRSFIVVSPTLLPGLPGGQSFSSGRAADAAHDRVVRVDGSNATRAIAGQGCVNNPRVLALAKARLIETLTHYEAADGLFVDWAEYTCYLPEDIFTCFCVHCENKATRGGLDWDAIRRGVGRLLDGLSDVSEARLRGVIESEPGSLVDSLADLSGCDDDARTAMEQLMRFKADSVEDFFVTVRNLAAELHSGVEIGANAFAPPWNGVTGSDFAGLSAIVGVVRCKLFTFHWPMMTKWMCEFLMRKNPGLSPQLILEATKTMYQVPTSATEHRTVLSEFGMPQPDERHPITMEALNGKLASAKSNMVPGSRLEAYIHSYRPADEFAELLEATSHVDGSWIQRYGYLSDRKLELVRDAWS